MTVSDRIADLSLLWKQASLIFPYFDRCTIDWDQAYRESLPRVLAAGSDREFHLLLAEFLNLLGDGHTDYLLPKSLQDEVGYLPFSLRFLEEVYCIDATVPDHEVYRGAQLLSLNGVPFSDLLPVLKRYSYHIGDYVHRYRLHQLLPFFLNPTENRAETSAGSFFFDLLSTRPTALSPQPLRLPDPSAPSAPESWTFASMTVVFCSSDWMTACMKWPQTRSAPPLPEHRGSPESFWTSGRISAA